MGRHTMLDLFDHEPPRQPSQESRDLDYVAAVLHRFDGTKPPMLTARAREEYRRYRRGEIPDPRD